MIAIPQLSNSFWESHPALDHIRLSAWESKINPASPDAVLGVCLCRVAAMISPETRLPNDGSLNYLVALVAPSGSGKTTSKRLATKLIPDIGTDLDSFGVGSGEGLIESYLRTEKDADGNNAKVQRHTSAFFYVDEAESFLNSTKRDSSTTLGTLRSMWSGGDVGVRNAKMETTRHLKDGSYRFSCAMGFQPDYAIQLIRDDAAGTPQRFLFVSALDIHSPLVSLPSLYPFNVAPPQQGMVHVDSEIQRLMGERRRRALKNEIEVNHLDSHRDLLHLKTAYLLSVLCGSTDGVTMQWWTIARELVDVSASIRSLMLDLGQQQETDERIAKVNNRIETDEILDERRNHRIARNLGRYALKHGPSPAEKLISKLAGRDRNYADIDDAIRRGYLVAGNAANQYKAGPKASTE